MEKVFSPPVSQEGEREKQRRKRVRDRETIQKEEGEARIYSLG